MVCEINNHRSNWFSGPLAVKFIDPASGMKIATLEPPKDKQWRMWCRFEIPLAKLLKPSNTLKLEPLAAKLEPAKSSQPSDSWTAQASRPASGAARLIFVGEPARTVLIEKIDAKTVRLNDPQHAVIPRNRLVWIELLDWQAAWLSAGVAKNPGTAETPPLRFSCSVFPPAIQSPCRRSLFGRLIVPPYALFGISRTIRFLEG